jgi:hypothetical protein
MIGVCAGVVGGAVVSAVILWLKSWFDDPMT